MRNLLPAANLPAARLPAARLLAARGTDPARPIDPARHAAVLAMGELSPDFEDKPALLALERDGHPLDRPRATIPGDRRGGRGVHDIVRLSVDELPARPR